MLMLRRFFVLVLLFCAGAASGKEADVVQRLERSLAAGTGGEIARFMLCNADAVLFFADGHQTPELISDWRAWEEILMWENPAMQRHMRVIDLPQGLTPESEKVIDSSKKEIERYIDNFRREGWKYARMIDGAPEDEAREIRIATKTLSNKATAEMPALARKSLDFIEAELSPGQWQIFVDWLQRVKTELVIGEVDHLKVRIYQLDQC